MAVRDAASLLVGLFVIFHTWGAWADVDVNMEDRVEVIMGETAQITCMFTSSEGIGGMMIQWSYVTRSGEKQRIFYQDSTMKVVERGTPFTERISVNGTGATGEVVLTISDVQLADEVEFVCYIRGLTDGSGEGRTKLKVFKTPDLPTIEHLQKEISVNEKDMVKIGTCEVKNGFPKPNITWYSNTTPLRSVPNVMKVVPRSTIESSGLFSVTSELNMKVVKEHKDDEFYCEVTYFVPGGTRMTETYRINITVFYPSTAVNAWVESPKGKIKEGDSIELHCVGNGNSPSSVISFKRLEDDKTWEQKVLLLPNVSRLDSGGYECTSLDTDTFESVSDNISIFVNYLDPAVVMPQENVIVAQGADLKATCNALSSLQTQTVWIKDGQEVSKGHTLMVEKATFDKAGTYMCVVTVPEIEGMETSGTLLLNVRGPPEILNRDNTEREESYETMVDLSCHVRGYPTPKVIWTTSDGKVLGTASEIVTEDGVKSEVSIKVTSDITAFCNASNEAGTDVLIFNIKAIKPASAIPKKNPKEGSGAIIAAIIICILLLAILGSVLFFLYKKGKICGRSGKQDLTKDKSSKDNIVVEMKSDNTEEAVLLGVNGEKQPAGDQSSEYLDVQK
uniref:melanoma cell adhesion molecule b isoform X4 n=1 Tax=Semicossyphus pulcher TaxID=241346 RepID=UPI0037E796ED